MGFEKVAIKNERPGIMLTPGLPPKDAVTSAPVEDRKEEFALSEKK